MDNTEKTVKSTGNLVKRYGRSLEERIPEEREEGVNRFKLKESKPPPAPQATTQTHLPAR